MTKDHLIVEILKKGPPSTPASEKWSIFDRADV
jgi:hypothetical protein